MKRFSSPGGAALIMVLVTLTVLIFLVVPFAVSMRVAARASRNRVLEAQVQLAATGAVEYAVSQLSQTCDNPERLDAQPRLYKTPDYDALEEYQVSLDLPIETNNPKGMLWSITVEDEQGKIPLNSAHPWLLGNLLGSAMITQTVKSSDNEIIVDSTHLFPANGGLLWINGELIEYKKTQSDRFMECQRGMFSDSPRFVLPQHFPIGTLVLDAQAYRICRHRLMRQEGQFTRYRTVEEIRSIADLGVYSLDSDVYQKIAPFLTAHAGRDNEQGWVYEQRIQNDLPSSPLDKNASEAVQVLDGTMFTVGQTVRIQQDSRQVYAMVLRATPNVILLDIHSPQNFEKGKATISVLQTHPININSAHPRVLFALWKGLKSTDRNQWIDSSEAEILASSIFAMRSQGGYFKSTADLERFLINIQRELRNTNTMDTGGKPALQDTELQALLASSIRCEGIKPRFAGLHIPAKNDGYGPVWPPISSLAYRNFDTYTLTGTAICHNDTGVPLAKHTTRKIIQVSPHRLLQWKIESQKDFTGYLQQLSGYRVITWPNLVSLPPYYPEPNPDHPETGLSLDSVPLYPKSPQNMTTQAYHPWNDTHEGITCPEQTPSVQFSMANYEVAPGSLSLWFFPPNPRASYSIFDLGFQEWQDRMALYYDRGELIFQVSDANMQYKCAEVWTPISLEPRWYHLRAAWHSTHPGGLDLWIDGRPVGEFCYRERNFRSKSFLATKIQPGDTHIPLTETMGFPNEGVVRIGDEAIEYSRIAGSALVVRDSYPDSTWDTVCRGARGTTASEHPKGSLVTEFGYSDTLATKIFPATQLSYQVADAGKLSSRVMSAISASSTTITANAREFPPRGFLLVAGIDMQNRLLTEIVSYGNTSSNQFTDCQRGLYNTTARDFPANETYVFPISLFVKDTALYEDSGFVQLDQEWISYVSKTDQNILLLATQFPDAMVRTWLQEVKAGRKYTPKFRSCALTLGESHDYGTKVIPVFTTRLGWLGKYDQVTVLSGQKMQEREAMEVAWAYGRYAAFTKDVTNTYQPGQGSRILKFPSGELPTLSMPVAWGKAIVPMPCAPFQMDELHLVQARSRSIFRLMKDVVNQDDDIEINSSIGLTQGSGLFKIGNEYVGYQSLVSNRCQEVTRGFAQTKDGTYSAGTFLYSVSYLPISSLDQPLEKTASEIVIQNSSSFPEEGYLSCNEELIGYTSKAGNQLIMPKLEDQPGLLRGSYGTSAASHPVGTIVYSMPVRYWDRYLKGYDGPEGAYFEASKSAPGAWWHRVTWREDNPYPMSLGVKIKARLDGKPDWSTPATNQPGGIYEFTDPQKDNFIQCHGDNLELRVYFYYRPSAYQRSHWTSKILLKTISVEYWQPTRILQSESNTTME